ncbi:PucR family transcriptional regulator ligand-binding domain-containing protein [Selenihalanaerobacter shriftii]|uniref:AraC-type DNA-binding protein n=1 Tax=Selenihalanaerobacter shriftii TaxID=142842 RepID=A0A1T4MQJ7_9FIRM|nr:PucR family transcriptional regulator ligand-binding domain-containing protein [Selenihalanaerobacter shriftii]SJZ69141.1 AraC-type DNA-binding protein [Selenihalanaerobacter shriftii]
MGLTIREALELKELQEVKIVAGRKKVDNEIRWIHIGETSSIADWLKGGELLLTCAHGIKDNDDEQEYLIKELADKDIAALAIEPGYYFENIPQNMIKLANELDLTLLEIPKGMPFLKLTEVLMDKIVNQSPFDKLIDDSHEIYGLESKTGPKALFCIDKEQILFDEVKYGNRTEVFRLLKEIFIDMLNSGLEEKLIKTRCLEIAIMLSRAAIEGGVNLETALHLNDQLIKEMDKTNELKDKFDLTKHFVNRYMDLIHEKAKMKNLETVQKVKDFIWDNYSDKLTLDQISSHVYLSASHLSKIFKEATSVTIMEYVNQIRLRESKKLLRKTEMPLNKIAEISGYYDASYFSKVFKRESGITPGQYRLNTFKRS